MLLNLFLPGEATVIFSTIFSPGFVSSFREGLSVSRQLGDRALEAQACYSLGSVHSLLRDNKQSVEYHERHKEIAEELNDRYVILYVTV